MSDDIFSAFGRGFVAFAHTKAADLVGDDAHAFRALALPQRYALFFDRFIDALRRRPLTLEILAAEIVDRNELTAILETEREQWGAQAEALIGGDDFERTPQLRGITLKLISHLAAGWGIKLPLVLALSTLNLTA